VDGVISTVYEELTTDEQYRDVPFPEQDVGKVEKLTKWNLKIPIEEEDMASYGTGTFWKSGPLYAAQPANSRITWKLQNLWTGPNIRQKPQYRIHFIRIQERMMSQC